MNKFFNTKGRLDCKNFFYLTLVWLLGVFVLLLLASIKTLSVILLILFILLTLWYIVFIIKRLHDLNLSGYWLLLCPLVYILALMAGHFVAGEEGCEIAFILTNLLFGFILFSRSGSDGANRYGEPSVK